MPAEVFPNVAESTLSVAATNVATTFTLASGAPFNTTGQFRLRLDDSLQQGNGIATRYEICRATFNAGNVVNVFRSGADLEGTTAQAWPIGTKVVAIVTAAGLTSIASNPALFAIGSAIVGAPPSLPAGRFLMQAGSSVVTTDGSSNGFITYPTPFPNGVLVNFLSASGDTGSFTQARFLQSSQTVNGFTFQAFTNGGATILSTAIRVGWLALGW